MEQYISKAAVKAEIEKLKSNLIYGACASQIAMETRCKEEAYNEVLSYLDSLEVKEVEESSKDLEEAARRAAVDKPDIPLEFLMERPYDSVKEQKFIEGAMWQKRHDNISQELVENYCEFIKEGGKNVCALINAVNACNAKKAECISNNLEEAASQYSFNIQSAIFNDLTPVLQNIWKREIEGAFVAGAKLQEEQIMKNAIERDVKEDAGGYPFIEATELYDYDNDKPLAKAGDKVKVLIVKDK